MALIAVLAIGGCGGGDDDNKVFEPSVVITWNHAALDAIRNSALRPTVHSRALFLLHASMYDAWAAYSPLASGTQLGGQLRRPAAEVLRGFTGSSALFDSVTQVPYDRNRDGVLDFVGEFIAPPNPLAIEPGLPSQAIVLRWKC